LLLEDLNLHIRLGAAQETAHDSLPLAQDALIKLKEVLFVENVIHLLFVVLLQQLVLASDIGEQLGLEFHDGLIEHVHILLKDIF
jgi:hypothetical protein